jgi:SAM-dependent methyltransferase
VVDLGCGTGRTGAWLRSRGVGGRSGVRDASAEPHRGVGGRGGVQDASGGPHRGVGGRVGAPDTGAGSPRAGAGCGTLDGVDITPEMLARARERGIYDRLVEGDVTATGLPGGSYDLLTTSLVDEHLEHLGPLYAEAFRLAAPGASYALAGIHPHFLMASGIPTHFDRADGEGVAIDTHLHLLGDHVTEGLAAGWTLVEMRERLVDEAFLAVKPKWAAFVGHPFAFALVWRRRH